MSVVQDSELSVTLNQIQNTGSWIGVTGIYWVVIERNSTPVMHLGKLSVLASLAINLSFWKPFSERL